MQKYLPVLLLALLLVAGWQQQWWKDTHAPLPGRSKPVVTRAPGTTEAVGVLNRRSRLEYTKHAICRMECREVTKTEVQEILTDGSVNMEKSNPEDQPCPTYALEGYSNEGQHLRVVFAPCDENNAKVITCIDLDKDWTCDDCK
ncbi:DUF4258 domain-containing protein [Chitinophaga nivalis]|uniref:DUF4258 domain-containing protein n=1 Tax=Chitinophaga nivalis TaxID=2991709 RepID=A0ABT3IRV6_9BACT|nr:DUF4258 domain-containing protein [Chitinophaga nivalis]MCW3463601.1 DUF4258 domain-containing protein [Chitinophaga nivalis]MCW3486709.1 DUF4258 domain-containing protein [Chitinophaga nivalis]